MPWFRVDDTFAFNPKVIEAEERAPGSVSAWVRMGSWCAANLTNGKVPASVARSIANEAQLDALVSVRFLYKEDTRFVIHQYLNYQPSKEEVEADREAARNRRRKGRNNDRPNVGQSSFADVLDGRGSGSSSGSEGGDARGGLLGNPNDTTRRIVDRWRTEAESVLDALNAARKRVRSSSRGIVPTYDSLKHIADRLEAGKSVEDCLHVIAVCEADYRADVGTFKWFDQVTPFRPDNFEKKCAADPLILGQQRAAELMASRPKPPSFRKKASGGGE